MVQLWHEKGYFSANVCDPAGVSIRCGAHPQNGQKSVIPLLYCEQDASANALRVDLQRALCFTRWQFPSFPKIAWSLPDEHP
jgi:hypothetical protein